MAKVVEACGKFEGDLKGTFYPLEGMDAAVSQQLIDDHFLFKEGDRFLKACNLNRDWPSGRGIFHNVEKTFLVWVNEEDQLRIISMQKGAGIKEVFDRLCRAAQTIEKIAKFSHDDHLGYITSCPTNLGTAMRGSVHIKLPKLSKDKTVHMKQYQHGHWRTPAIPCIEQADAASVGQVQELIAGSTRNLCRRRRSCQKANKKNNHHLT